MNEIPNNSPESREPELIEASVDTLVEQLATTEGLREAFDWALERQFGLYEKSRQLREQGEVVPPALEAELDEINQSLLDIQSVFQKFGPQSTE